jgi:hypothetical protein
MLFYSERPMVACRLRGFESGDGRQRLVVHGQGYAGQGVTSPGAVMEVWDLGDAPQQHGAACLLRPANKRG